MRFTNAVGYPINCQCSQQRARVFIVLCLVFYINYRKYTDTDYAELYKVWRLGLFICIGLSQ